MELGASLPWWLPDLQIKLFPTPLALSMPSMHYMAVFNPIPSFTPWQL
jgi:hypothetical protein